VTTPQPQHERARIGSHRALPQRSSALPGARYPSAVARVEYGRRDSSVACTSRRMHSHRDSLIIRRAVRSPLTLAASDVSLAVSVITTARCIVL